MNIKNNVWFVIVVVLALFSCNTEFEGCPEGSYPYGGECVKGCPTGTREVSGKCEPFEPIEVDGDESVADGDSDGDESVVDGDETVTDGDEAVTDGDEEDSESEVTE